MKNRPFKNYKLEESAYEKNKEKVFELICDEKYVPMRAKDIAVIFNLPKKDREELYNILFELTRDGKISKTRNGRFKRTKESNVFQGVFLGNRKGYGFVAVEGEKEDFYIREKHVNTALDGDIVRILKLPDKPGKRKAAKIINILERKKNTISGTYYEEGGTGFVLCDNIKYNRDIIIRKGRSKGARNGSKVLCRIISYGEKGMELEGEITEIIGLKNEPGVDILSVIADYDIPTFFPKKAINEAEVRSEEDINSEIDNRRDLRDLITVTIDGEDSKDLDDAVSLTKEGNEYILYVHIADVSHYVEEGSALDKEAKNRGNSVYLPDRVIPMLPKALSNGICSLNEGEDRLTLSVKMILDKKGNLKSHEIFESVIRSDKRMTYESVKKILVENDKEETERYKDFVSLFKLMEKVSAIIRKNRVDRGAIDFDFPESKIVLDENGVPLSVEPEDISVSNRIIEDFMLLTNETVAKEFYDKGVPFLYRTHGKPDQEKINTLLIFLEKFGYTGNLDSAEVKPKDIQRLLLKTEGSAEEGLIRRLTLRSMQQARYTVLNNGHFGLSATYYCHFTSPIRRYPDLIIHRIIKEMIKGSYNDDRKEHYDLILPGIANHSSETERRAEECEREVLKMKKAEYMKSHIGEIYDGVVSGLTGYGIYVELENTVEGLIPIAMIDGDDYFFDEDLMELVGVSSDRRFTIGQSLKIRVERADKEERIIDFSLYE